MELTYQKLKQNLRELHDEFPQLQKKRRGINQNGEPWRLGDQYLMKVEAEAARPG